MGLKSTPSRNFRSGGSSGKFPAICALDLGTTKFCLASLAEDSGPAAVKGLEIVSVDADGMRRGMLANLERAQRALAMLIEESEGRISVPAAGVVVGVAGSHLQSQSVPAEVPLATGVVTQADILALTRAAEALGTRKDREVLHVIPCGFRVDRRDFVEPPVGFQGRSITGSFFVVDADQFYLRDVVQLCNNSGLQVARLYAEPVASAAVTATEEQKSLGVAVCDIGGGTTDGIVFVNGRPARVFTVNIAGRLITNDLAIGLNLRPSEAEKVKIRFGLRPREGDGIDLTNIHGEAVHLTGEDVMPFLVPRVRELATHIESAIGPYRASLGAGVVLTGGGAGVIGLAEFLRHTSRLPVITGWPTFPGDAPPDSPAGASDDSYNPKYATALGLLNLELCHRQERLSSKRSLWPARYLGSFINWIREIS